jgi:hypothetical protein
VGLSPVASLQVLHCFQPGCFVLRCFALQEIISAYSLSCTCQSLCLNYDLDADWDFATQGLQTCANGFSIYCLYMMIECYVMVLLYGVSTCG